MKEQLKSIIEETIEKLKARIADIDYEQENYELTQPVYMVDNEELNDSCFFQLKYKGKDFANFRIHESNKLIEGGVRASGSKNIHFTSKIGWYKELEHAIPITIDESRNCKWNDERIKYENIFNRLFNDKKEENKKYIEEQLESNDLVYNSIRYDPYSKRFHIDIPLKDYMDVAKENQPATFYKYMTLDTFMEILKSGKLRLNSIVSMNDSSESFYLGDYLCNAYEDRRLYADIPTLFEKHKSDFKNKQVVEKRKVLISSFCTKEDDATMWRLYGGEGTGVCLSFECNSGDMKPVTYIDTQNDIIRRIRNLNIILKQKNIHILINDIEKYRDNAKSIEFKDESEYRIIKECDDVDSNFTKYGDTIAFYHDYTFEELGLIPKKLYLGTNLKNKDVNYPLLVHLAVSKFNIDSVVSSKVTSLRLR